MPLSNYFYVSELSHHLFSHYITVLIISIICFFASKTSSANIKLAEFQLVYFIFTCESLFISSSVIIHHLPYTAPAVVAMR